MFDTSRVRSGSVILREAHLERLVADGAALGIQVPRAELERLADAALDGGGDGALRLTVTRGPGGRGLAGEVSGEPTLMARFSPLGLDFPMQPVRLGLTSIRRNPTSPTARHKTLSYTDNILALRQVAAAGFEEALFLSVDGNISCASAANVFLRFGNDLLTPAVGDGAMPGITRAWLLKHARSAGFNAEEAHLSLDRLEAADGILLTNSLRIFQTAASFGHYRFDPALPAGLAALGNAMIMEEAGC